MRCLFTMFAEDTGLLEPGSFTDVLSDARANPESFAPMLEDLWRTMDTGGFSPVLRKTVRKFNGGLFAERTAIPLHKEEIGELYEAARHVWTEVEPAIFGTLLEQAQTRYRSLQCTDHSFYSAALIVAYSSSRSCRCNTSQRRRPTHSATGGVTALPTAWYRRLSIRSDCLASKP